jgi:hypothetical protein
MEDTALKKKFDLVFDNVCTYVDEQRASTDFSLTDLKNMLETEYANEGNGWDGKGEVQEVVQAATIAAYQQKIAAWEKEGQQT